MASWLEYLRQRCSLVAGITVFMIAAMVSGALVLGLEHRRLTTQRAAVEARAVDQANALRVTLEHGQAANFDELGGHDLRYELARIDPDTGARQGIAASPGELLREPAERQFTVPDGTWVLSIEPAAGWGDKLVLSVNAVVAALFSLLLGWLANQMMQLRAHRADLQRLVAARSAEVQARQAELDRAQSIAHVGEQQLRKLSTAVEHSPALIVITDRGGNIEYVNPQFERCTGYTAQEVVGKNPRILKSGNRSADEYAAMWAMITHGQVWRGEFENVRKDGTHYWETASIAPIRAVDGTISGFVAVKEDITLQKRAERALIESEMRYRQLFANSRIVMLVIDPANGSIVDANAKACEYYGYGLGSLTGMKVRDIDALGRELTGFEPPPQSDGSDVFRTRHRLAGGGLRDVEVASSPIEIAGRKLLYSIVQDVTERKGFEERMRQAMVVFNACNQGIMTTDAQGVITSINPAFCTITGYLPAEAIGRKSSMFKPERHEAMFFDAMWTSVVESGSWAGEVWSRRKGGDKYPQWVTVTAVRDTDGKVAEYVTLFSDITERKQQEVVMWRQANFDPLTGLANRSLLQDRLGRALAHARRHAGKVGLLFLDLDGFKWINDSLGHDVGDELLVEVAHRLNACVRDEDTVARLGGDEFTIVVHNLIDPADLGTIAEKLVATLREPFALGGARHHISGSIGITVFPDDGNDVQTLLRNADIAMYKAKQAGKNRAQFYAHQMQVDALARVHLEADLRIAVEQRAFELHYQPIVDGASGALVGAEALIRWKHPGRGMISPLEFIPVAEDCGLIVPIGEWVLREAVRQRRDWLDRGYPPLRLAVNVSGVQFREAGLAELVRTLLAEYGTARGSLVLEITESVLMGGSENVEACMGDIKEQGLCFALDDFGTGFSSLSYLKRFPVDVVKIDRSFVRDCPDDRSDASLVEAIINMAHSLGLRVTAEGVESAEQREFLRGLGCDYLQGYLIGKPLAVSAFETMMAPLRSVAAATADCPQAC